MKRTVLLTLIIIALIVAFYPAITWMFARFTENDSYYSHGFIIPLITAFLLWRKRAVLAALPASSSLAGLGLLLAGLALYGAGWFVFRIGFAAGFYQTGLLNNLINQGLQIIAGSQCSL